MKTVVNIFRIITGVLFIFSGLVKAIDPLGLAYKMQEFFEAFAHEGWMPGLMNSLNDYALAFSITMITLEVVLGIALLLGAWKKLTTFLLLLLMLLFLFLTAYVLFSGRIRACGCFGDCVPLTPVQTFAKDVILLIMILVLFFYRRFIHPVHKPMILWIIIIVSTVATIMLQYYVLRNLPVVDCLPFKKGNNVLELRKMPADAVQDKFDYVFVYSKDGKEEQFSAEELPDSTWEFVDRKQILIEKGRNNIPAINDYHLTNDEGVDVTETLMEQDRTYYLFYLRDVPSSKPSWLKTMRRFLEKTNAPVYVVVSQRDKGETFIRKHGLGELPVLTLDATAIKTAARSAATLYQMKGAVVKKKWGTGQLALAP